MMISRRRILAGALLLLVAAAGPVLAGEELTIRLVEATAEAAADAEGLQDVLPVLRRTLPSQQYRLVAAGSVGLPSRGMSTALDEYEVRCAGSSKRLDIEVRRGGRETLRTTVVLQRRKPLIVAGLLGTDRNLLFVFLVK